MPVLRRTRFRKEAPFTAFLTAAVATARIFFYFLHGHDMGVHGKALQRPLLGLFRELPGIEGHAFCQADGFLFLIDQFVRTVGSNLHDDKADGVGA